AASPTTSPDANIDLACIVGRRDVREVKIDLFLTLDKSRSMHLVDVGQTQSRWEAVSGALARFVAAPLSAGLGASISFFPRVTPEGDPLCSSADYAFPVVPVGTLPAVAPSILKAIALQTLESGTPMTSALDGSLISARRQLVDHPDHLPA